MDANTRIIDLTVGQLVVLIQDTIKKETVKHTEQDEFVEGLSGLAQLLGVSVTTAQKIKNSGILNPALGQVGRKIIINATKAREIYISQTNK